MDFGCSQPKILIEEMDTLNETQSLGEDELDIRRSFNSSFSGSGFLGWSHADDDTSLALSGVLHSSLRGSLSQYVDSSGFLDWDQTLRKCPTSPAVSSSPVLTPPAVEERVSELSPSTKPTEEEYNRITNNNGGDNAKIEEEEWRIEDYENDDTDRVVHHARNTKPRAGGGFFNNTLKRLSLDHISFGERNEEEEEEGETIQMNDVKDALQQLRPNPNRKQSLLVEHAVTDILQTPRRRRRQTVTGAPTGLSSLLGGGEFRRRNNSSGGSSSPNANRPSIAKGISLFNITEKPPFLRRNDSSGGNLSMHSSSQHLPKSGGGDDHRGVIWINAKDGGLDIDAERRKLYEQNHHDDKKETKGGLGGFIRRRITLDGYGDDCS